MAEGIKPRLKALIIESLMLEDMEPDDIEDAAPLFGEGLGLDSVDALELAMEIERVFGVTIPQDAGSRTIFRSVDSLSDYIAKAA